MGINDGRVVIVTGSGRGIGREHALAFAATGAKVVVNDLGGDARGEGGDLSPAMETVEDIKKMGGEAIANGENVADCEGAGRMVQSAIDAFGRLDVLVNNAGILRDRTIAKMTLDEWRAVIDVNLSGVFHGCKYGLEVLRDGGCIVNLGSLAAEAGFVGQANYSAAKAGVQALTRVLAREAAKRSIRVNAVAPGIITTPMTASMPEAVRLKMENAIPLGRPGRAEEVAGAVLFLCSPLSAYVTGHTLRVDGGWRG
jgi:3-oxoacyl-[acyl-carrier protein] reductase